MFDYMFKGRIDVIGYLIGSLILVAVPLAMILVYFSSLIAPGGAFAAGGSSEAMGAIRGPMNLILFLSGAIWVVLMLPLSISLAVRRWHDLGQSGWMTLLTYIPYVGLIFSLILLFVPGKKAPNVYGSPKRPRDAKSILLGSVDDEHPLDPPSQGVPPQQGPPAPGTYGAGPM